MAPKPPYYFLDFWALVIIGLAVFALMRSRCRKRPSRTRAGDAAGLAHDEQTPAPGAFDLVPKAGHR